MAGKNLTRKFTNLLANLDLRGHSINSLTAESVPAGAKLVLFGRDIFNFYVGIDK